MNDILRPYYLLGTLAMSFGLCLALVPAARVLARRWGLVDQPDGHRKIHKHPTPVSGGLAILAAVVATLGLLFLVPENTVSESLRAHEATVIGLLLGSLVIVAVGMADDLHCLRRRYKLIGQIVAAGIVVSFTRGIQSIHLFGHEFDLGWFGVGFTIFFLVATINSLNLIDGMDGLLGSVGVILSLSLAAMACLASHWWAAAIALALAGALFGFLRYNLSSASIFLGDSGSMLVGLVLGTLAIQCSLKAPSTLAIGVAGGIACSADLRHRGRHCAPRADGAQSLHHGPRPSASLRAAFRLFRARDGGDHFPLLPCGGRRRPGEPGL